MTSEKKLLVANLLIVAFCLTTGILSYLISPSDWSWGNLLMSISVALFQLFLGILLVNIYIAKSEKKELAEITESEKIVQARQCLSVIHDSIAAYHGRYLELLKGKFDLNELQAILKEFIDKGFNPDVVSEESINKFTEAIKPEYGELLKEVSICLDSLKRASSCGLFGSNAQDLYQYSICLHAGNELLGLKSVKSKNRKDIFEKAVKFDLYTQNLRRRVIDKGDLSKLIN